MAVAAAAALRAWLRSGRNVKIGIGMVGREIPASGIGRGVS